MMKYKSIQMTVILSLYLLALPAIAQQLSLQELEQRCEAAREANIAPLREEAIEECVVHRTNNRRSGDVREHCERFYRGFGAGGRTESGGFRQRMFHNIPECLEFYEAEQAARRR
jgi:hypothetical protein